VTAVGDAARRRREQAAARYRPERIDTLLVSEAPPSALDRYFYFEDVGAHDSLFRHVVEAVLGEKPTRDKAPYLDELRERGWFLVHMSEHPFRDRSILAPLLPDLTARCEQLAPGRIVVVGAPLYDLVYPALRAAGLPVVDVRMPYPGSGQQRRFLDAMRPVVTDLTATSPTPSRSGRS
jgi:hypothetical protein